MSCFNSYQKLKVNPIASRSRSQAAHSKTASTRPWNCSGILATRTAQFSPASAKILVIPRSSSASSAAAASRIFGLNATIREKSVSIVLKHSSTSLVSLKKALRHSTAESKDDSSDRASTITFRRGELTMSLTGTSRNHEVIHSSSWGFLAADATFTS